VPVADSPLLNGGYVRPDKPLDAEFDHPGTPARQAALREVAKDADATVNQVVLAWLIGAEIPMMWRLARARSGPTPDRRAPRVRSGCVGPLAGKGRLS
jgi:diketogulonate reductase-like aldo/keto reductase